MPWATVSYTVSWTTSSAVSGARIGASLVLSRSAATYDSTAASVVLAVRRPGIRPHRASTALRGWRR